MSETKSILRQEALKHRILMDPRSENPEEACSVFLENIVLQPNDIIASYMPLEKEFDPDCIIQALAEKGHKCAYPIVEKNTKILSFALWQEGEALQKGPYNILQPVVSKNTKYVTPDLLLVPLLAFDRYGQRLGFGGGYYDATLRHLRQQKSITAIGVGFAQQICLFRLPREDHDEKLDWVITPKDAHNFM